MPARRFWVTSPVTGSPDGVEHPICSPIVPVGASTVTFSDPTGNGLTLAAIKAAIEAGAAGVTECVYPPPIPSAVGVALAAAFPARTLRCQSPGYCYTTLCRRRLAHKDT